MFIAWKTASLNTTCPDCATPSIRDVVFTASPKTSSFLIMTSPVCMATRILIGLRACLLNWSKAFCNSIPHKTAFVGDLNVIRKASPIFLMTLPPYFENRGREILSKVSCSLVNSSLLNCAVVFVYPTMSVNMTVRISLDSCTRGFINWYEKGGFIKSRNFYGFF